MTKTRPPKKVHPRNAPDCFVPIGSQEIDYAFESKRSTAGSVNTAISAATSPISFPKTEGTSSHAAAACGSASSAITLRAGPRIRSPSDHAQRTEDDHLRIQSVDQQRKPPPHPLPCRHRNLQCIRIVPQHCLHQRANRRFAISTVPGTSAQPAPPAPRPMQTTPMIPSSRTLADHLPRAASGRFPLPYRSLRGGSAH